MSSLHPVALARGADPVRPEGRFPPQMDAQKVIWHAVKKWGSESKSKSNYSLCDADASKGVVPANTEKAKSEITTKNCREDTSTKTSLKAQE